jgi:hypothetical protein
MGLRLEGIETAKVLDIAQRSQHVEFKVQCGSDSIHLGIYDKELVEEVSKAWTTSDDEHQSNQIAIGVVRNFLQSVDWVAKVPEDTRDGRKSPHTFHVNRV